MLTGSAYLDEFFAHEPGFLRSKQAVKLAQIAHKEKQKWQLIKNRTHEQMPVGSEVSPLKLELDV